MISTPAGIVSCRKPAGKPPTGPWPAAGASRLSRPALHKSSLPRGDRPAGPVTGWETGTPPAIPVRHAQKTDSSRNRNASRAAKSRRVNREISNDQPGKHGPRQRIVRVADFLEKFADMQKSHIFRRFFTFSLDRIGDSRYKDLPCKVKRPKLKPLLQETMPRKTASKLDQKSKPLI